MSLRLPKKAWVVSVSMGYGHERAAYALKEFAHNDEIIIANNYQGIPKADRKLWSESQRIYETISRMKSLPVVGPYIFEVLDRLQEIPLFYPRRDLSDPTLQVKQIYRYITKKKFGRHLVEQLSKNPIPLITTFFIPAFAADVYGYPGDIYCVLTDADVSRAWAPLDPKKSRIKYLAPTGRVVERMQLYGVPASRIFLTGFPMPKQLIGGPEATDIKHDMAARIFNLDPNRIFMERNEKTICHFLGTRCLPVKQVHPLTLAFAVGGAGAQRALGVQILESLQLRIKRHEIRLRLIAGVHKSVYQYFYDAVKRVGLKKELGKWVEILWAESRAEYFDAFTRSLHDTDILWTKPSELSFYCGLGIPILMAPPVGSQEDFNELWLQTVGGGVRQNDPRYTDEWLFDWINSGGLAKVAWSGFIEAPTHGTYRIEDLVHGRKSRMAKLPLVV